MEFEDQKAEEDFKLDMNKIDTKSQKSKKSSAKTNKSKSKPAWALTEKQQEEEREKEIDDLIEFAYDLDYEKYMEDYEVRQALAVIKDRVKEIKQNTNWKEEAAKQWNEAEMEEHSGRPDSNQEVVRKDTGDQHSVYSYSKSPFISYSHFIPLGTGASKASKTSYKSRLAEEKRKEQDTKS